MLLVRALGAAEICVGDHRITPTSARSFALALYLAAERGRRLSRVALQELIFPAQGTTNAAHSLRQLLYKLRADGAQLTSDAQTVILAEEGVESDYGAAMAAQSLSREQLESLQGGFLPGYEPDVSSAFHEWLSAHRAKVELAFRRILLPQLSEAKARVDWDTAEQVARACLALDPLNEE